MWRIYHSSTASELAARLFVDSLSPVPLTKLLEFDFTLHQLFILGGPVVYALAFVAGQFDQSILRHAGYYSRARLIGQNDLPL